MHSRSIEDRKRSLICITRLAGSIFAGQAFDRKTPRAQVEVGGVSSGISYTSKQGWVRSDTISICDLTAGGGEC
jgi:hypothetical protein